MNTANTEVVRLVGGPVHNTFRVVPCRVGAIAIQEWTQEPTSFLFSEQEPQFTVHHYERRQFATCYGTRFYQFCHTSMPNNDGDPTASWGGCEPSIQATRFYFGNVLYRLAKLTRGKASDDPHRKH